MPRVRAEQIFGIGNDIVSGIDHRLTNAHIANSAGIKQSKIEAWQDDASGWISEGVIKMVPTAELPIWDGSQAGQMYYDLNTNELFIGLTTQPYYQLIAGAGVGDAGDDRELVLKMSYEATNWTGVDEFDPQGTASIFDLESDTAAGDGSNILVFLNGVLQEMGSGNDYMLYADGDPQTDKIQFTYNIEGPDQKLTVVINSDSSFVNYATKSYVDEKFFGQYGHDHDGIDSNQLDFNTALTASSLGAIIHDIIPNTNTVNLGSVTNPFGSVYADEGHFAVNTIYLGNVAISGAGDTFNISSDGGTVYNEVVVSGVEAPGPIAMTTPTGETITLASDTGLFMQGDILPEMTGATGAISARNIGSASQVFSSAYINSINGSLIGSITGDITTSSISNTGEITIDTTVVNTTGDVVVQGNLTVSGTTTTVNSETITMADNILVLNSNETGIPTQNAGLEIERGTSTSYQLLFNEVSDTFEVGMVGSLQAVATRQDAPISGGVAYWDSTADQFITHANFTYDDVTGTSSVNAATATKLATARTIDITGDITASAVNFDGTADIVINASVNGDSHIHTNATLPDQAVGSTATGFITYNGNVKAVGKFYGGSINPDATNRLNYDGYFYATRVYNAVYNDLAEFMPACCPSEPGMVLVQTPTGVSPATSRGDGAVVGVYSDSYGYALGGDEDSEGKVPVGLSGRVWVWVEEPCSIGNLLITSEKAGFGTVKRSAEDGLGKVFAKVMEEKTDSAPQRVEVLILMA